MAAEKVADLEAELAAWEVACEQEQADLDTVLGRQRELQARVDEARQLMAQAGHLQAVQARLTAANEKFAALNIQGVLARQDGRLRESRLQADRNADLVVRLATALPTPVPAPAAALQTVEAVAAVEAKPLMSSLVDGYFQHRQEVAQATHQVMNQDRGTLRRFVEVCGDRPVNTYRRADVTAFLAKLRRLPAVYGRSAADREASFADLIARAQASGCETLSEKTVKRHLSALTQFFGFCVDESHMGAVARMEMLDKHKLRPRTKGAREQRDMWTSEELVALFRSPVWRGRHPHFDSRPGPTVIRDAVFWIPLLALYQGGRLEEYADLSVRDVFSDEGVPAMRIQEDVDENGRGRRLKTDNSVRVVPLHPEILRMGFLTYVQQQPSDGPLFPDLAPQGADAKRGPRITRWFGRYRQTIKIYREGVGMHAFRHTANTRLRNVIKHWQQERHVAYMLAHSQGGGQGSERYDKGPGLRAAAETLALLQYPELDLSHLYVEPQ